MPRNYTAIRRRAQAGRSRGGIAPAARSSENFRFRTGLFDDRPVVWAGSIMGWPVTFLKTVKTKAATNRGRAVAGTTGEGA